MAHTPTTMTLPAGRFFDGELLRARALGSAGARAVRDLSSVEHGRARGLKTPSFASFAP